MAAFIYDDFDDNNLGAYWDYDVGNGSAVEQNQRLEQTVALEDSHEFGQTFTVDEIDVWVKVTAPANYLNIVQLIVVDVTTGDYGYVEMEGQGAGAWILNRGWGDGVSTNGVGDSVDIGSNNSVWLRLRYVPSEGDTFIRTFYALTDPLVGGWIEGTRINGAVVPVLANGNSRLEFRLFSDTATQQTVFWDFASEWGASTSTTTTTTTTTQIYFVPDEFNDGVIADFWNTAGAGTVSEADGQLILSMDPSENAEVNQENLNDNFDIWCKVKLDTDKINYVGISNDYYDNDLYGYIGLSWDANGTFSGKRQFILEAYYEIDQGDTYVETIVGLGLNVNEVYIRMKYNNGRPFFFYALDEPQSNEDWIEIELPDLPSRNLVDYTIDLYSWTNAGSSLQALVDFIRNWSPEPILAGSQGARGSMIPGLINEGFGGFGFGWG